jgi:ATP-dependent Lon protease
MPASRWNQSIIDLLSWFDDLDELQQELFLRPITPRVLDKDEQDQSEILDEAELFDQIPPELPILPLRGVVVYPQTAVPLTIGQPRSIRLVDDVMAGEDRLIGLVASKDPELDMPAPDDLYTVGTVAIVHRLFRAPDGTIRLLVQGLARFHLGEFVHLDPYLKAKIELFPESMEDDLEVEALARNARDQFEHIAEMIPSIPRELVTSVVGLEDPLQTIYTIANFQRMDLNDAQELLELDPVLEKLKKLVTILTHEVEMLILPPGTIKGHSA